MGSTLDQPDLPFTVPKNIDDDNLVWDIIRQRVGAENAIQSDAIQAAYMRLTGNMIGKRTICSIVERLIRKRRKAIYGSKRPPYGYFVLNRNRPEEIDAAFSELYATAVAILIRARDIKQITNDDLVGQLRMGLDLVDTGE